MQWPILRLKCAVSVGVMGVVGESKKSGAVRGTGTVGRWDIAGACRSQPCEEKKKTKTTHVRKPTLPLLTTQPPTGQLIERKVDGER